MPKPTRSNTRRISPTLSVTGKPHRQEIIIRDGGKTTTVTVEAAEKLASAITNLINSMNQPPYRHRRG